MLPPQSFMDCPIDSDSGEPLFICKMQGQGQQAVTIF